MKHFKKNKTTLGGLWKDAKSNYKLLIFCSIILLGLSGIGTSMVISRNWIANSTGLNAMSDSKGDTRKSEFNQEISQPSTSRPTRATSSTPQLSKEYIYAGNRMLAIEDAGAVTSQPASVAIWRPSSGAWWFLNQNSQVTAQQWGTAGDVALPGDYDGDGRSDIAVYRPSNGSWYVFPSSSPAFSMQFGISSDTPKPADYDGDGKTDICVVRVVNNTLQWYTFNSSNSQISYATFGLAGDVPVPGDYDGDGKADIAVWRPSNGVWYYMGTSDNQLHGVSWGSSNDKPIVGDYDGDRRADFAVWRPDGTWSILFSSGGSKTTSFGFQASDVPVASDYDGDGKTDVAVWRPSNGTWYIQQCGSQFMQSNCAFREIQFGQNGDVPVPGSYNR